jgi:hypothetical protein
LLRRPCFTYMLLMRDLHSLLYLVDSCALCCMFLPCCTLADEWDSCRVSYGSKVFDTCMAATCHFPHGPVAVPAGALCSGPLLHRGE